MRKIKNETLRWFLMLDNPVLPNPTPRKPIQPQGPHEKSVIETAIAVALGIGLVLAFLWLFVSCKAEVRIQPQSCKYDAQLNQTICSDVR